MAAKATFAALPPRAIGDRRLAAIHFRVLAAVAFYDRLSGPRDKGAGCYASNKTLAEKCNVNPTNFSTAAHELGRWGYLICEPHPLNKRTRVYRVLYDDLQNGKDSRSEKATNALPVGKEIGSDALPDGKAFSSGSEAESTGAISGTNALPIGNLPEPIVCPQNQQHHESKRNFRDIYIPLNGNRFCETEINSAEAAPLAPPPMLVGGMAMRLSRRNPGAALAMIERAAAAGRALGDSERQLVSEILEKADPSSSTFHQANRILSAIGDADAA